MPGAKQETAPKITQATFIGGQAIDDKNGITGAMFDVEAMDFRQKASRMSVLPGNRQVTNALADLPTTMLQTPDGVRYMLGDAGHVYRVATDGTVTDIGTLNSAGAAGMVFNQQSDQIYMASQQHVSLYGQIMAGSPGFKKDQFGPSASAANGVVNLFDAATNAYDIPRNNAASIPGGITPATYASQITNAATPNTYTAPATISEVVGNFCPFVPDIEPFYSVPVWVTSKGTDPSSGPSSPGTLTNVAAGGTTAWVNPGNAAASDDVYATWTAPGGPGNSDYLQATNFGFSIPNGATITGIKVEVEAHGTIGGGTDSADLTAKLIKGGSIVGNNKAVISTFPTGDAYIPYGSSSDLWGTTLTPADVNASNFGFAYQVTSNAGTASIDHIRITVYYAGSVTLTMHDSLNNSLGAVTLSTTGMSTGWNNFIFSGAGIRAIPNAFATGAAAGYHFHLTSPNTGLTVATVNASDLTGANFLLFAHRLVQTNNGWHPMVIFGQYLVIGNGPYVSTYNFSNDGSPNNNQWVRHQLSLDYGYEVCGLSVNNNKLVIAAEKRSTNASRSYQDGFLYFWDGANVNYNDKIEVPMGSPYALNSKDNITYFIAAGSLYAYGGGQQLIKVRYIGYQNTDYLGAADATIVNPNMMDTRYNLLLIAYPSTTTIANLKYGVYSWGAVELTYPNSFGYSYALSNGGYHSTAAASSNGNLQIGMIRNFVDTLYTSYRYTSGGVTRYCLDILDNFSKPAANFNAQNLIWDGGVRWKMKRGLRVKINFLPLPANTTLNVNYTLDRGTVQTASTSAAQGETSAVIEIDTNFYEIQWGFVGTSSPSATTPATITGWACEVDTLSEAQDLRPDEMTAGASLEAE